MRENHASLNEIKESLKNALSNIEQVEQAFFVLSESVEDWSKITTENNKLRAFVTKIASINPFHEDVCATGEDIIFRAKELLNDLSTQP